MEHHTEKVNLNKCVLRCDLNRFTECEGVVRRQAEEGHSERDGVQACGRSERSGESFKREHQDLEVDPVLNRKPVELMRGGEMWPAEICMI